MMKHRLISLLLTATLLLSVLPPSAQAAATTASGTHGTNLSWTLNSDGVLTITGTGAMSSKFYGSDYPWYSHRSAVKTIKIGSGVTSITTSAFENFSALTAVSLPETLTSIGQWAFYNCPKLVSITLPESLKTISSLAFRDCDALTSIRIPAGVTSLSANSFAYCDFLTAIYYGGTEAQWDALMGEASFSVPVYYNCCVTHSFTKYVYDGNATLGSDGTKTAKCDNCAVTSTVPDPESQKAFDGYTFRVWTTRQGTYSAGMRVQKFYSTYYVAPYGIVNGKLLTLEYAGNGQFRISMSDVEYVGITLTPITLYLSATDGSSLPNFDTSAGKYYLTAVKSPSSAILWTLKSDGLFYTTIGGTEYVLCLLSTSSDDIYAFRLNTNTDHDRAVSYSRMTFTPPHVHSDGEPVREKEVAPTYINPGSYEEVIYCADTSCGEELSRKTIPVPATGPALAEKVIISYDPLTNTATLENIPSDLTVVVAAYQSGKMTFAHIEDHAAETLSVPLPEPLSADTIQAFLLTEKCIPIGLQKRLSLSS